VGLAKLFYMGSMAFGLLTSMAFLRALSIERDSRLDPCLKSSIGTARMVRTPTGQGKAVEESPVFPRVKIIAADIVEEK